MSCNRRRLCQVEAGQRDVYVLVLVALFFGFRIIGSQVLLQKARAFY